MDGFVLPHFESTCILKDKDVLSVTKKGSISAHNAAGELASEPHCSTLELKHVDNVHQGEEFRGFLTDEEFKIETGGYQSESEMDDNDQFEDTPLVESTPEAVSKKEKHQRNFRAQRRRKVSYLLLKNHSFLKLLLRKMEALPMAVFIPN
ncbi:Coilin [Quillaja saponaria]|uniref:Coilin n=1 Tax=Quillaja saponaria TaxID=32244 RepID=A0AAD7LFF9_QUISA|nr:Coilin [Quillaja saponaria]